ncbi:MAG TPA: DNA repair protein RecO [Candidatus Nitrosotenuis sp.]|jgi:DNA repair protein RecO (recombination protein O)|nr:DNA repair protein RecO [Candidatus Nitrosotenuis sp.]
MKWTDEGIILALRPLGEGGWIASLLTRKHGRHVGVLKVTPKNRHSLQPGIVTQAIWRARLSEHLGTWSLEATSNWALWFHDSLKLAALSSAVTLTDKLLPERHPYEDLYELLHNFITFYLMGAQWLKAYVNYEMALLEMLGFGLDLSSCVVTGSQEDLIYISPKSGRSVSREAAVGYESKLLPLPCYWRSPMESPPDHQLFQGLQVTGHFLAKHLTENGLPHIRSHLLNLLGYSST